MLMYSLKHNGNNRKTMELPKNEEEEECCPFNDSLTVSSGHAPYKKDSQRHSYFDSYNNNAIQSHTRLTN